MTTYRLSFQLINQKTNRIEDQQTLYVDGLARAYIMKYQATLAGLEVTITPDKS